MLRCVNTHKDAGAIIDFRAVVLIPWVIVPLVKLYLQKNIYATIHDILKITAMK